MSSTSHAFTWAPKSDSDLNTNRYISRGVRNYENLSGPSITSLTAQLVSIVKIDRSPQWLQWHTMTEGTDCLMTFFLRLDGQHISSRPLLKVGNAYRWRSRGLRRAGEGFCTSIVFTTAPCSKRMAVARSSPRHTAHANGVRSLVSAWLSTLGESLSAQIMHV